MGWRSGPTSRPLSIQAYPAKHSISLVLQPPYSPNMAPCDFKLFPKSLNEQKMLKGKCFESREEITWNLAEELYTNPEMLPAVARA